MANENVNRVAFNLYLDNPEHKKVYEILKGTDNKNRLIRSAILAYEENAKGREQMPSVEDIKYLLDGLLKNWSQQILKQIDERMDRLEKEIKEQPSAERQIDFDRLK